MPFEEDLDKISILKLYDRYIAYVRHENDLLHQRTTWLVTTQGGFLLILCYMLQKYFEVLMGFFNHDSLHINTGERVQMILFMLFWLIICMAGICSLFYAGRSIEAACKVHAEIRTRWVEKSLLFRAEMVGLPDLLGGGNEAAGLHGAAFARSYPKVLSLIWICLGVLGGTILLVTMFPSIFGVEAGGAITSNSAPHLKPQMIGDISIAKIRHQI